MNEQLRYRKGEKIGGRYLVHQALAGGMGEVYFCLDLEQNLPFALKTFQPRFLNGSQGPRPASTREAGTWVASERLPQRRRCRCFIAG